MAEVFDRFADGYLQEHRVSTGQLKLIQDIRQCRTVDVWDGGFDAQSGATRMGRRGVEEQACAALVPTHGNIHPIDPSRAGVADGDLYRRRFPIADP